MKDMVEFASRTGICMMFLYWMRKRGKDEKL